MNIPGEANKCTKERLSVYRQVLFEKVKLAKKLYLYSIANARCVFVRHSHSFISTQNTLARGKPSTSFITDISALYTFLPSYIHITTTLTMKEISQFIPKLSSVCKIYSGVISGRGITCEDTLTLVAFINSFPSAYDVECGIWDNGFGCESAYGVDCS